LERRDTWGRKEEEKRVLGIQVIRWWVCDYISRDARRERKGNLGLLHSPSSKEPSWKSEII